MLPAQEFLERAATSNDPVQHEWHTRFQAHLSAYGHMVYNLDFMNPVPADDPIPLLQTLRFFVSGKGADPYERQRRFATRREEAAVLARLDPVRARGFRRLVRWAQSAHRSARMRWPMSGWLGLRYAACSSRSVGDSSRRA